MHIVAKSPCRVDLAGGTLDIWPLYLHHPKAVTVNFAVNRYTRCSLRSLPGGKIILRSRDLKCEEHFDSYNHLAAAPAYKLPLLAHVARWFMHAGGFELETDSEAPAGAGISGSSALLITLVSAFNALTKMGYDMSRIRELAQNIEAQIIKVPTGCQDYFPAMFGGINAIELRPDGLHRFPIPNITDQLNSRAVLAYTGEPRNSGINNWEVTKRHIDGDPAIHRNFEEIAAIASCMRLALAQGDWPEVARLLREEWKHRKKNAPGITTPLIDRLIEKARRGGAVGAKVCGAGGGGCVFFLTEPGAAGRVSRIVTGAGAEVLPVKVARRGVQVRVMEK